MKKIITFFVVALCFHLVQSQAFAESFEATVTTLYEGGESMAVTTQDESGNSQKLKFFVKPDAELSGITSLRELELGDRITVEAERRPDPDSWDVQRLEKV